MPLSVSIAVEPERRILVAMEVAQMPCKGHLQKDSERIYGKLPDKRKEAREKVFNAIKTMALPGDIHTDGDVKIRNVFTEDGFLQISHTRNHNKHSHEDASPEVTLKQRREAKC